MKLSHGYRLRNNRIDKPRPYDDASYYYAMTRDDGETWELFRDGKRASGISKCDGLDDAVAALLRSNSAIKPRMCHN